MTRTTQGPSYWALFLAALVAVGALSGCGGDAGPAEALADVKAPSWFAGAQDTADEDGDPPRWTRRYAKLPKSASDVEMVYAQALDRAGWRYQTDCDSAPPESGVESDCWTRDDLVLAYTATPLTSDDSGPSKLEIVLHEAVSPSRAMLDCPIVHCRVDPVPGPGRV